MTDLAKMAAEFELKYFGPGVREHYHGFAEDLTALLTSVDTRAREKCAAALEEKADAHAADRRTSPRLHTTMFNRSVAMEDALRHAAKAIRARGDLP